MKLRRRIFGLLLALLLLLPTLTGCVALFPERAQKEASRAYDDAVRGYARSTGQTVDEVQRNPVHRFIRIGVGSTHVDPIPRAACAADAVCPDTLRSPAK